MRFLLKLLLSLPILAGFAGLLLPALGYFPSLQATEFSTEYWQKLFAMKNLCLSIFYSLYSGFVAWGLSLFLSLLVTSKIYRRYLRISNRSFSTSLLSVPHLSFAIGFAFLLSPGGWFFRMLHAVTGFWERPPAFNILYDSGGISYIASLVLKETPFLIFVQLGALHFLSVPSVIRMGKSLGYSSEMIFWKILVPGIYPRIRLASYVVLAYSISAVDMALVLGFRQPQVFQLELLELLNHPSDLKQRLVAAAGALCFLMVIVLSLFFVKMASKPAGKVYHWFVTNGNRNTPFFLSRAAAGTVVWIGLGCYCLTLLILLLWSFAGSWRYPEILPQKWNLNLWGRILGFQTETILNSAVIAGLSSIMAVAACVLLFENREKENGISSRGLSALIYLPVVLPQISFMFGLLVFLSALGWNGLFWSVVWMHFLFVFPYAYFSLKDVYTNFDDRYQMISKGLGVGEGRFFWNVKMPMLMPSLLLTFSVGFAVSFAQYLPTLLAGGGRINTVTLEAVSAAGGSNRKLSGAYAFTQAALPLLIFLSAAYYPKIRRWLKFHSAPSGLARNELEK